MVAAPLTQEPSEDLPSLLVGRSLLILDTVIFELITCAVSVAGKLKTLLILS